MKLSLSDARKLQRLGRGETLPSSQFNNALSALLLEEEVLQILPKGSRKTYYVRNQATLDDFLYNRFNVSNLSLYVETLEKEDLLRADLARQVGDTKIRPVRSFKGFCVNCYQPLQSMLNEKPFVVSPVEGSYLFISDFETFVPDPGVTVVGMENPENFRYIRQQAYLFNNITPLFVCRYPQTQSKDLIRWLAAIPNPYLHFGDFDPAGLNVFSNEYLPYLAGKAHYFVPDDIEEWLDRGSRERYDKQSFNLSPECLELPEVQKLVGLIHKHKRGLDQEVFIRFE